jgi:hypothetical protein
MNRRCSECGGSFEAKGSWQRRCWECWRAEKERDQLEARYEAGFNAGYATGRRDAGRALSERCCAGPSR